MNRIFKLYVYQTKKKQYNNNIFYFMQRVGQKQEIYDIVRQLAQLFERKSVELPYELKIALVYSLQYADVLAQYQTSIPMKKYLLILQVLDSPEFKRIKADIVHYAEKYNPVFKLNLLFSHPQIHHSLVQLKECLIRKIDCSQILHRYQLQIPLKEMKRIYRILNSKNFKILMGKITEQKRYEKLQLLHISNPFSVYFSHIKADTHKLQNCLKQGKRFEDVLEQYEDKISFAEYQQIKEVLQSEQLEKMIFEWQVHRSQFNEVKSIIYYNEIIDKNVEQILVSLSYGIRLEDISRFKNIVSAKQYKFIKKMCLSNQFEKYLQTLQKGKIFDQMLGKLCWRVIKLRECAVKMQPFEHIMEEYRQELKFDTFYKIKEIVESEKFRQCFYNPTFKVIMSRNFELERSLWKLQEKGIKPTEQIQKMVIRWIKGQKLEYILQNYQLSRKQKKTIEQNLKQKSNIITIKRKLTIEEEREKEENTKIVLGLIGRLVLQRRISKNIVEYKNIYNYQLREKFGQPDFAIEEQKTSFQKITLFNFDQKWTFLEQKIVKVETYYQKISVQFNIVLDQKSIRSCIKINELNQMLEDIRSKKNNIFADVLNQSLKQIGIELSENKKRQLIQYLREKDQKKKNSLITTLFFQSSSLATPILLEQGFSSNLANFSNTLASWKKLKLWKLSCKQPPEGLISSFNKETNIKKLVEYIINDFSTNSASLVNQWFKQKAESVVCLKKLNIFVQVSNEGEGQSINLKISDGAVSLNSLINQIQSLQEAQEMIQYIDKKYWNVDTLKNCLQVLKAENIEETTKVIQTFNKFEYYIKREYQKFPGLPKMFYQEQSCKYIILDFLKKQFLDQHKSELKKLLAGFLLKQQTGLKKVEQMIIEIIQGIIKLVELGDERYRETLQKAVYLKELHLISFSNLMQDYLRLQSV